MWGRQPGGVQLVSSGWVEPAEAEPAGGRRPDGIFVGKQWAVQRTPLRQVRRGVPRAGQGQFRQVQYHYPAERCSRRPSPRKAGGRAARVGSGGACWELPGK